MKAYSENENIKKKIQSFKYTNKKIIIKEENYNKEIIKDNLKIDNNFYKRNYFNYKQNKNNKNNLILNTTEI